MGIEPGLAATVEHLVTSEDTASTLGSGDVDVFGTPALVALCERAAVLAVSSALEPGQTSLGTNVTIDHLAPTAVGRRVSAAARLDRIDGRTLHFHIDASDSAGAIARGTHTRVIVDRDRFLTGVEQRG